MRLILQIAPLNLALILADRFNMEGGRPRPTGGRVATLVETAAEDSRPPVWMQIDAMIDLVKGASDA